jgi:hypothetical protein
MRKMLIFKHSESEDEAKDISVFIPLEDELAKKAHYGTFVEIFKSGEIKVNEENAILSTKVIDKWRVPTSEEIQYIREKAGNVLNTYGIYIND